MNAVPEDEGPRNVEQPTRGPERDARTGRSAAAERILNQTTWVEQQLRVAHARGDFDDLPGAGKPIRDLGSSHDPDWWLKRLVERENISVLPPALALRVEDERLEDELDRLPSELSVREELEGFNARVRRARMQLEGGPPVITPLRDVEVEVAGWHARRRLRAASSAPPAPDPRPSRRRRLRRRGRRPDGP